MNKSTPLRPKQVLWAGGQLGPRERIAASPNGASRLFAGPRAVWERLSGPRPRWRARLFRAPAIEDALAEVRHLTVDLRMVTFIDATTLVLLLGASRRQQAHGGELLVLVGPQTPMTAFEATGFDRLLAIRRLDDEPRNIAPCTAVARGLGLSPPPHTTLKGRNSNGNNGNN